MKNKKMDKYERYTEYRKYVEGGRKTFGDAYNKLHELYDENNIDELVELGSADDLFLYNH